MIPNAFAYERATSIEDALQRLHGDDDAKLLAGGHSLLPLMKMRLANPAKLVDLSTVAELHGISREGATLVIGAATTHAQIAASPVVKASIPALAEAAGHIGDLQVRNRGTIGGNLAHADPASDLPAVALAFDAGLHVRTAEGDEVLSASDYFLGPLLTALPERAVIVDIRFDIPPDGTASVYEKFAHPASGYAVVGVAAAGALDESGNVSHLRVAITGAADVVYRAHAVEAALLGGEPTGEAIRAAAAHAADDGEMAGDLFASETYRSHLCQVYTARALHRVFGANL